MLSLNINKELPDNSISVPRLLGKVFKLIREQKLIGARSDSIVDDVAQRLQKPNYRNKL
jgi:hypothetical protein